MGKCSQSHVQGCVQCPVQRYVQGKVIFRVLLRAVFKVMFRDVFRAVYKVMFRVMSKVMFRGVFKVEEVSPVDRRSTGVPLATRPTGPIALLLAVPVEGLQMVVSRATGMYPL